MTELQQRQYGYTIEKVCQADRTRELAVSDRPRAAAGTDSDVGLYAESARGYLGGCTGLTWRKTSSGFSAGGRTHDLEARSAPLVVLFRAAEGTDAGSKAMRVDQERQQAHAYLDRLPPAQLRAVRTLLESMVEPAPALGDVPVEDEEISEEEERAAAEARGWLNHNQPIPHEAVLADFGLTIADWECMGATPLPNEKKGF